MSNPWSTEADKHESKQTSDIRDMRFKDNHTHNIRIIPDKDSSKLPFYGYTIHWIPQANSKKGKPIVHSMDHKCGICKYVGELWQEIHRLKEEEDCTDKSPEVKKIYAKITKIGGKKKYDMNIFDRDDMHDDDGKIAPKRMGATTTVWKPIFSFAKKWGSPSDIKTGYDFELTTEGEGEHRKYTIAPDRDASPLSKEELVAVKRGYDLERLRQSTDYDEVREILENAQSPFDELLDYVSSDDFEAASKSSKKKESKSEPKKEPKPEPEEIVKEEEPVVEEKTVEEPETTEPEEVKEEKPVVEKTVEEPETTSEPESTEDEDEGDEDPNDMNNYECRGEIDEEDEGCKDCPVKDECKAFVPYLEKAKKLEIDVSLERDYKDIISDVKAKEEPAETEAPKTQKRGKLGKKKADLPF